MNTLQRIISFFFIFVLGLIAFAYWNELNFLLRNVILLLIGVLFFWEFIAFFFFLLRNFINPWIVAVGSTFLFFVLLWGAWILLPEEVKNSLKETSSHNQNEDQIPAKNEIDSHKNTQEQTNLSEEKKEDSSLSQEKEKLAEEIIVLDVISPQKKSQESNEEISLPEVKGKIIIPSGYKISRQENITHRGIDAFYDIFLLNEEKSMRIENVIYTESSIQKIEDLCKREEKVCIDWDLEKIQAFHTYENLFKTKKENIPGKTFFLSEKDTYVFYTTFFDGKMWEIYLSSPNNTLSKSDFQKLFDGMISESKEE